MNANATLHPHRALCAASRPIPSHAHHSQPHEDAMPILSSCILAQAATLFVCLGLVPAVVITSAPTNADVYAVLGAALASALAGLEALSQKKNLIHTASVLLASAGIGAMGPGAAISIAASVLPSEWQKWIPGMTWNVWAFMGLIFGIGGWGIVRGLMNISRKQLPELVEEQVERIPRIKKPGNGSGSMPVIAMLIIPWCLVCCTSTTTTTQTQPSGKQVVTVVKKEPSPAIMPLLGALVEPGYGAVVAVGGKLVSYVTGWLSKPKPQATTAAP